MKNMLLRLVDWYAQQALASWVITLRSVKGSALTHAEMDANFTTLRDVASQTSGSLSGLTSVAATTGTFTNIGGTLSTAAQPNVTSVGTLTGLTVSGSSVFGNGSSYWTTIAGGAGSTNISAASAVANASLDISAKGAGSIGFWTGSTTNAHLVILDTASTTRYVTITGSAGGNPTISTNAGSLAIGTALSLGSNSLTAGAISGSGILTLTTSSAHQIGSGGTAGVSYIDLLGGSDNGTGVDLRFKRNGTLKGNIGTKGGIAGGASDALYLNAVTGNTVDVAVNATTITSTSSTGFAVTGTLGVTGVVTGTAGIKAGNTSWATWAAHSAAFTSYNDSCDVYSMGADASTMGSYQFYTSTSDGGTSKLAMSIAGGASSGSPKVAATFGLYINESANTGMTTGLTINQGAADDEILSFKSSDIAHGMTDLAETDTYAFFKKNAAADGGFYLAGFANDTATVPAVVIRGISTADQTTKATTSAGVIVLSAKKKSTTTYGNPGADANLLVIQGSVTRFIFDEEGSAHADVEWIAFDHHDDITLLNGLNAEMLSRRGAVQENFGEWVRDSRDALQREGIFNFYDDGPRAMMNMTKMHMLEVGAIRQLARKNDEVVARLGSLEKKLLLH